MAIEFQCPQCSAEIRVADSASGKKGTCPTCGIKLRVPRIEIPENPVPPPPLQAFGPASQPVYPGPVPGSRPDQFVNAGQPGFPTPDSELGVPPFVDRGFQGTEHGSMSRPASQQPAVPPPATTQPTGREMFPEARPSAVAAPAAGPTSQHAPTQPIAGHEVVPGIPDFDASQQGGSGGPAFPEATAGPISPVVGAPQSIAVRTKRRARRKSSGLWFPIIAGLALVGALIWAYGLVSKADIEGDRVAYAASGDLRLPPKQIPIATVDVPDGVKATVLEYFNSAPKRLRSQMVETEFGSGEDEGADAQTLPVRILPGDSTVFVRFPIDADLRAWFDQHADALEKSRTRSLDAALKAFFTEWDEAIRNQTGVEDFAKFRDSVALSSCVGGLGYHLSAQVENTLLPCVFEDDGNLYYLIPEGTQQFTIVGLLANGKSSQFPGRYSVTVQPEPKK